MKEALRTVDRAIEDFGRKLIIWSTGLPPDVIDAELEQREAVREEMRQWIIDHARGNDPEEPRLPEERTHE